MASCQQSMKLWYTHLGAENLSVVMELRAEIAKLKANSQRPIATKRKQEARVIRKDAQMVCVLPTTTPTVASTLVTSLTLVLSVGQITRPRTCVGLDSSSPNSSTHKLGCTPPSHHPNTGSAQPERGKP